MIEVGLAGPDRAGGPAVGVQLVPPAAALAVDEALVGHPPEGGGPVRVPGLPGRRLEIARRADGLGQRPVQPLGRHLAPLPVHGVGESAPAGVPAVGYRAAEQLGGRGEQAGRLARHDQPELQEQPGPLEAVARRGAERPEPVARPVAVVVGQRLPVRGEVLGDAPLPRRGETDEPAADGLGPAQAGCLPGRAVRGQEGFHRVHVGVEAAVGIGLMPALVPGVHAEGG